jgi:hypothetical protein
MSIRQNRYVSLFCRSLLLAGYLFLFAGQFSYRYFSISNFFVYGGTVGRAQLNTNPTTNLTKECAATHAVGEQRIARVQHGVVLHDNGERATHLSIDKRFHLKESVRVPQIRAPGLSYCTIVKTRRPALTTSYSSTDLPFTSLRGPPSA